MHAEYPRRRAAFKPTPKSVGNWPGALFYKSLEAHSIGSDALLAALKKSCVNTLSSFQFRQITPSHSRVRVFGKFFAKAYR